MKPKRPIRIACLGDWGRYFSYFLNGTQEGAIRNGCWFRPVDIRLNWKMKKKCLKEFRPDILFTHMIFPKDKQIVMENLKELRGIRKQFGTKVFYHLGDARTEPRYPADISEGVDACLVNQYGNLDKFSKLWNVPTYHWPYGCFYQDKIAAPVREFQHGLVFTGLLSSKGIHAHRTKFIADLQQYIGVTVYPSNEYPDTKLLTAEIAASAKAVLGVCAGYDIDGYLDVRPFQYAGAGAFLMQRKYLNIERVFKNNEHMVIFPSDDPEKFYEMYKDWMSRPKDIKKVRQQGFAFCQKYHNCQRRVEDVLRIVYSGKKPRIFLEDI